MTLAPLFQAPLLIQLHAWSAIGAFGLGIAQFARGKGTPMHRGIGWIWILLMAVVAATSFGIHTICSFGPFSLIHLLSIYTLVILPVAVLHARRHRVVRHKRAMILLFLGALVIAGAFTFSPGRIMHDVAFGTATAKGACS